MTGNQNFDVIIIGGSYSGLAAAMALGRSLRRVLIIDSGNPCNRQTPHSHNFITHDGKTPSEIKAAARQQVENYKTISFLGDAATATAKTGTTFSVQTRSGKTVYAKKLIFATGIRDILPPIEGYAECWGISVLHCPYCHGYEVRNERTGILANGAEGFEFSQLISNWTKDLVLFTDGPSTLSAEQTEKLHKHHIKILETPVEKLQHEKGHLQKIIFTDGTDFSLKALYGRNPFDQHCDIPKAMRCDMTDDGYIKVDVVQNTSVPGVFACGDNASRMRTLANAIAMGTTAGMAANKQLIVEEF